eukprot:m.261394 g.261394  ORF g.261394 m.261394 type:complete len:133 (-) comp42094_c0_seq1:634-1032(-)
MAMENLVLAHVQTEKEKQAHLVSSVLCLIPLISLGVAHKKGLTLKFWQSWYNRFGVYGFFAVPFVTITGEKCVYDSLQSLQGIDPCVVRESRQNEGFPSGGAKYLPSFSLFPVRDVFNIHTPVPLPLEPSQK